MIPLLDTNTLMALGWEAHEHHERAWKWFERQDRFATCVLTQIGFLHASLVLPYYAPTPQAVRAVLEGILNRPGHLFIPCEKGIELFSKEIPNFALEHYLAALAQANDGKLAVLERIPLRKGVLLIP